MEVLVSACDGAGILVLNVGAVIGLLVAGAIADSRGNKTTVLVWFGLAAVVFLALLSIKIEHELLVYVAVLLTGIFVFSAQVLVYAIVGPSVGGALVTAGIAYPGGFYAFSLAAVIAVVALATVPAHLREVER